VAWERKILKTHSPATANQPLGSSPRVTRPSLSSAPGPNPQPPVTFGLDPKGREAAPPAAKQPKDVAFQATSLIKSSKYAMVGV
jgi:hypothetical protein